MQPPRAPRRAHAPWLRSVEESDALHRAPEHRTSAREVVAVAIVVAAVIAMAIWFFFFASGGPGPGTV